MILYHCVITLIDGTEETCGMYDNYEDALEWAEEAIEGGVNFDMMEENGYIELIPLHSIFKIKIQAIEEIENEDELV